jgi:hypothetical protein
VAKVNHLSAGQGSKNDYNQDIKQSFTKKKFTFLTLVNSSTVVTVFFFLVVVFFSPNNLSKPMLKTKLFG